jgi:hypothetical protein
MNLGRSSRSKRLRNRAEPMSAPETLQALREAHPLPDMTLTPEIAARISDDPKAIREVQRALPTTDIARVAFDMLLKPLPDYLKQALARSPHFDVGVADLPEINASARRTGNEGTLIVMNFKLAMALYKVARAVSLRFSAPPGDPGSFPPPEVDPQTTPKLILEVVREYLAFGRPVGSDYPVDRVRLQKAYELTLYAEMSVIAHELGHHVLGHLAARPSDPRAARRREAEADEFGWRLLIGPRLRPSNETEVHMAVAGSSLALQVFALIEDLAQRGARTDDAEHPGTHERIAGFGQTVQEFTANDETFSWLMMVPRQIEQTLQEVQELFHADQGWE